MAMFSAPEMLFAATGANRTRVRWSLIKNIELPLPSEKECKELDKALQEAEEKEKAAISAKEKAITMTEKSLSLESNLAKTVLEAFKPPR